jgi:proline iminopeptidase
MTLRAGEGYIQVDGGRVWYEIRGEGDAIPLLCLHGGPGFCHDYLESLFDLADDRPVVMYDQLGCGNSERPGDPSLWIAERHVIELRQVRDALGLDRVHLLGQSWGSMLAVDYVLTRPAGVESIVLASPCTSIPMWLQDTNRLRRQLPAEIQEVLDRHEAAGTVASAEYAAATLAYYRRHLCRMDPWPMSMERSMVKAGYPVYNTMWGPSEFNMSGGNLRYYDRTPRLHEIALPALWTCGRYDEAQPDTVRHYQSLLPGSELVVFEESSHTGHLEERERYMAVVRDFLARVESTGGRP